MPNARAATAWLRPITENGPQDYSLNLPIPDDLEGQVPLELYSDERLAQQAVDVVPVGAGDDAFTHRQNRPAANQPVFDDESQAVIVERMRALGYLQ